MSNRYKFYPYYDQHSDIHKVVAVSTYAGKIVRGVAKCDPRDEYDYKKGAEIAKARCDVKVAEKRSKRASQKLAEAVKAYAAAGKILDKARSYYTDALNAENEAKIVLNKISK